MDVNKKSRLPNPSDTVNKFSKLFFIWILPLLRKGRKQDLTFEDVYDVRNQDVSADLANDFEAKWTDEVLRSKESGKPPKLLNALVAIHGKTYFKLSMFILFIECTFKVAQPIMVRLFIKSFDDPEVGPYEQYLYAAAVCLSSLCHTLIMHQVNFRLYCMAMKFRIAITSLIFRKSLRLSRAGQGQAKLGRMINLMGNDVYCFDLVLLFFSYIVVGPIQLVLLTYILWNEIGVSCFAGIGFICSLMPLQCKYSSVFRLEISNRTDERARFMNEIITGIRVIKMYAWEKPFAGLISRLRHLEVKALTKLAYLQATYLGIYNSALKPIILLTLITYLLTGNQLTADKVFFAVACFNTLLYTVLFTIPTGASAGGSCIVSLKRIQDFLLVEEQSTSQRMIVRDFAPRQENAESVSSSILMKNVNASWTLNKHTLCNLNLDICGDKLVMVVGAVGSGKSSFLNCLIAELPISSGSCTVTGTSSYASQEAWIFTGTIRENILFGRDFDEKLYREAVQVCALEEDLRQLPHGDATLVGERGVSLSGGQKARLNLARSLYQDADIVLLDDPLSAVDTRVSRHIFEKCVKQFLRGRLRILVTHQIQYLHKADYVIVLKEGGVAAQGTYEDLLKMEIDLGSILGEMEEDLERRASTLSLSKITTVKPESMTEEIITPQSQEEFMASGSISCGTYWKYFKSSKSPFSSILLVLGFILSQAIVSFSDYWLGYWMNQDENRLKNLAEPNITGIPDLEELEMWETIDWNYAWIFCGIVGAVILSVIITVLGFFKFSMTLAKNIHDSMFSSLIRSPTKFFDDNPSGRIMNRVTRDMAQLDVQLPEMNYDAIQILLQALGIVVVVVISNYYVIVPTVVVLGAFYLVRYYYVSTTRDLKRLDALSRSPLFTHLVSSFQGLATIRSSRSQSILTKQFQDIQDNNTSAYFLSIATTRWFAIWLEVISVVYLSLITFSFLIITTSTQSGDVGLAISCIITLSINFQWGMRQSAEVENSMTSVQRILEYADIQPEAPLESAEPLQDDWVKAGEIKFESVSLAYDAKDVLSNLSFTIKAKEKIGIVGRTGAGKSSIITALFRITEPRGAIYIDGVQINEIGLHELRKNISIIPQDPVLFSGTVRYNLDPFGQFQDTELWDVLEEVMLKEAIPSLEFNVADGGSNFSVGERQLVCLARAILRKNLIVILDEATANVDIKTDNFIQKTIRTKFSHCTILTIAHRLNSVMDCDKILVLDHGTLKEFDHPYILLQNEQGVLTQMISQTGNSEKKSLHRIAAQSFTRRDQNSNAELESSSQFFSVNL